jgi:hypothetical protein
MVLYRISRSTGPVIASEIRAKDEDHGLSLDLIGLIEPQTEWPGWIAGPAMTLHVGDHRFTGKEGVVVPFLISAVLRSIVLGYGTALITGTLMSPFRHMLHGEAMRIQALGLFERGTRHGLISLSREIFFNNLTLFHQGHALMSSTAIALLGELDVMVEFLAGFLLLLAGMDGPDIRDHDGIEDHG